MSRELENVRRDLVELSKDVRIGILEAQVNVLEEQRQVWFQEKAQLLDQVIRLQNALQRQEMQEALTVA